MDGMAENDRKWLKISENGKKGLEITGNGWKSRTG